MFYIVRTLLSEVKLQYRFFGAVLGFGSCAGATPAQTTHNAPCRFKLRRFVRAFGAQLRRLEPDAR
jgi:hypothetical protein